ncbi:hypothetical protein L345_07342, partial [Ophiophagus hannah]
MDTDNTHQLSIADSRRYTLAPAMYLTQLNIPNQRGTFTLHLWLEDIKRAYIHYEYVFVTHDNSVKKLTLGVIRFCRMDSLCWTCSLTSKTQHSQTLIMETGIKVYPLIQKTKSSDDMRKACSSGSYTM